jgi:hypothetical protein
MIRLLVTCGLVVGAIAHDVAAGQVAGAADRAAISSESEPIGPVVRGLPTPHVAWLGRETGHNGVLLVRGGGVLQGTITRVGDRYRVTRANGQLDVAAEQVTLACRSLEEAYERQRQQMPRDSAEAHLALAEWCLRYDLVPQAARELTDVRRLDSRHARLPVVERRLNAVRQSTASRTQADSDAKRNREQAAIEMQQLEAAIADLPAAVVERFARKVQPLLVNNCTTAGCHQPSGDQQFQLDRAVLHGLSNRRTTLRNLMATLELVNRARPQVSPLLAVPRRTHGGMPRPIFGSRQEDQVRQLVDWVAMVTGSGAADTSVAAASHDASVTGSAVGRHPPAAVPPTLRPRRPLRFGAEIKSWQPNDPFDPEIFNRQVRATPDAGGDVDRNADAAPSAQ